MSQKQWVLPKTPDKQAVEELAAALSIQPLTAAILIQRGLEGGLAKNFWSPANLRFRDFRDLPGTQEAGERIARAIQDHEPILIFGDYDVDGITSSALLLEFLRERNGIVEAVLPNRYAEGYGLNSKAVEMAANRGVRLLITVDCGINAKAEIAQARQHGMDVIVTDHHEAGPDLPEANVIVNPKYRGPADLHLLAGVGVVLMVVRAVASAMGENDHEPLRKHLDLVALGTVADVVPLLSENRFLTRAGLAVINRGGRMGLRALIQAAGLEIGKVSSQDLAYRLGPRLNAPGRVADATLSLELLLCREANRAEELAQMLNQQNTQRQQWERTVIAAAEKQMLDVGEVPGVILVANSEWPLGVVGLAASKLCEKYHRPCFVLSIKDGTAKGSARSIPAFPLHSILGLHSGYLQRWGGHSLAAGVTLAVDQVDGFHQALLATAKEQLPRDGLQPQLQIDACASLGDLSFNLVREFKKFEPYGYQNIRPMLALENLQIAQPPRVVGERHLKLKLTDSAGMSMDAIGFGLGDNAPQLVLRQNIAIVGHISENVWNNTTTLQLEIKDLRVADPA